MERKGEGPTRILCWMRATELKIVGEREGERGRERGREREREMERKGEGPTRYGCQMRATELKIVGDTHTHTHTHTQREREKGRETNKVFMSDVCDRIEDCWRERETENRSPGEGEVAFYASKTDINHVSI